MDDWVDVETPPQVELPMRGTTDSQSPDVAVSFYAAIERGALKRLEASKSPIFHVDIGEENLYDTFLNHLTTGLKQEYSCSTCRHFAAAYGDLALVDEDGNLQPLLWSLGDFDGNVEMKGVFGTSVNAIQQRFVDKKVTQEFKVVEKRKGLGHEERGGFTHMHLRFPQRRVRKEEISGFTSANTDELASMLDRVLSDYKLGTVRKVYSILDENRLPYADNHKGSAKWLLELIEEGKLSRAKGEVARHNLLYRYAVSSFVGSLKQMRSGALGALLDNVKANCSWHTIQDQWRRVCDPTQYMRPQAAPSAGNIKAAERLFDQLGLTKEDLKRRLLVQDDVPEEVVMWKSERMVQRKKQVSTTGDVFGGVKAKVKLLESTPTSDDTPPAPITFTRLVTKILPTAKRVEVWLERRNFITTLVTGLAGTKPLMQWHDEEGKNLASHYLWTSPPPVESHNLKSNQWNEVRCLIPFPWLWDGAPTTTTFPLLDPDNDQGKYKYYHKHKGFRYLFVLEKNHESNLKLLPLFPELLKSEFHGVRSTIEAFTKTEHLQDVEDGADKGGFVGGVEASRSENDQKLRFRVHFFNGEIKQYKITLFEG